MDYNSSTHVHLQLTTMRPKSGITESEKDLFRKTVKKVKPLPHTKSPTHTTPSVKRTIPSAPKIDDEPINFTDFDDLPPVASNDYLQFARPGIHYKILRKLKAGDYTSDALLDLHGETVTEAMKALGAFLLICQKEEIRHALIIHGKGLKSQKPVLKNKLNNWLRQSDQVLAFCTAKPKDGYTGALYVLLKIIKR